MIELRLTFWLLKLIHDSAQKPSTVACGGKYVLVVNIMTL